MVKDYKKKLIFFNDLPSEIVGLIFECLKIKDLRKSRVICTYWSKVITSIIDARLEMKRLHIDKKKINAISTNPSPGDYEGIYSYYSIFTNLGLYYTKNNYLLNNLVGDEEVTKFINKTLENDNFLDKDSNITNLRKISHTEFIDDVEKSCNNCKEMVWEILINITDSNDSLEKEDYENKFLINNYDIYLFNLMIYPDCIESTSDFQNYEEFYERFDYTCADGIIMVYPDKKTFSLHYQLRAGDCIDL